MDIVTRAATATPEAPTLITHLLRIAGLTALLTLCMLLPFLPGRYCSLAVPLSMMAQLFGVVGLLLVPLVAMRR